MSHRAALCAARAASPDIYRRISDWQLNHEAEMLACKGIFALPSNVTSCGTLCCTGGIAAEYLLKANIHVTIITPPRLFVNEKISSDYRF